jgi:hypothetical protein
MRYSRGRGVRTTIVLAAVFAFVASFVAVPILTDRTAIPGGQTDLRGAETPPSPPPQFNCIGFGAALAVVSPPHAPGPAAGIVGTVFELEGSGYYNRTSGPLGSFTIWMANYSGGSLLYLTEVPAGAPVDFFVNVTVPSTNGTAPFASGPYEFWSLENYTKTPTCANAPFNLTAVPPPSLGCLSWSAQLQVTSPVPANGTAGTPVGLQGRSFSPTGDTTIYWANATGSPYTNVGTTPTSDPNGWFNKTIDVPSGYVAGLYAFWAIDGDSDCAGAVFNLTGGPSIALSPATGPLGDLVTVTGTGFSASDTSISVTGAVLDFSLDCALSDGSITGSCFFDVDDAPAGPHTISAVGNVVGGPGDTGTATFTMTPLIAVSPNTGTAVSTFTVSGYGFSAYPSATFVVFDSEKITPTGGSDCYYDGPQITLDSSGSFVCTYSVPSWATLGVNDLQGDDTYTGDLTNVATFTIPQLTITSTPTTGPAGTPANVTGYNWPLGDTMLLQFAPVGDSSTATTLDCAGVIDGEPIVNATGGFTCSFAIPRVTAGAYSALAIDETPNPGNFGPAAIISSSNSFTVTTPFVEKISSTTGEPKPTTFTVGGLAPDTPYFVYLDTVQGILSDAPYNPLTTCTSTASGVITDCAVPVPSDLIPGTYYVDLYQDPNPPPFIFSVFNFTVTSTPSSSPSTGLPSSVLGLPILEFLIVLLAVVLLLILAVVVVRIRQKKAPPPTRTPPRKPSQKGPAGPP